MEWPTLSGEMVLPYGLQSKVRRFTNILKQDIIKILHLAFKIHRQVNNYRVSVYSIQTLDLIKVFDWRNPTDPIHPADPTYFYSFFNTKRGKKGLFTFFPCDACLRR